MAENTMSVIQIGQLNLRIPGRSTDTAHRVGNGIAQGLAQKVPTASHHRLGALSVRVQASANATESEMSDAIVDSIVSALSKESSKSTSKARKP